MFQASFRTCLFFCCVVLFASSSQNATASNLCVNPTGSGGCYKTISLAVSHAAAFDVINVWPGIYKEDVVIGVPLSLMGSGVGHSVIDATGLANGIFVDGFDNPGLSHVTIAGFTVKSAQWDGVLVVSASDVTIRNNKIANNTKATAGRCKGRESPRCTGRTNQVRQTLQPYVG